MHFKKLYRLTILLAGCLAIASDAAAQVNFYGGYGAELKSDKQPNPTILLPEGERIEKPLTEYSSCPQLTARCQSCTGGICHDVPSPPCSMRILALGTVAGSSYVFLHFGPEIKEQMEIKQDESVQICIGDEAAYIVAQRTEGFAIPILKIPTRSETIDAEMVDAAGRKVLQISYCVHGTGGCTYELYLFSEQREWIPLKRDDSWNAVYDNLPPGYSPHKTVPIDFEAMRWTRAIATITDGNCCPSGQINITLSIKNDRLHVDQYLYDINLVR